MESIIVQKYGGSSVASPEHIKRVAKRIAVTRKDHNVIVVVSAMGDTTDELISLSQKITLSPLPREMDMLLSVGERISMALLSMALHEIGCPAVSFTGSQSGIITNDSHTNAEIIDVRPFRINEELKKGNVVIVAGFQGVSEKKEITTLGRGGSDMTAVALAAAFNAVCERYSDVDGIFTADPKIIPSAKKMDTCSYSVLFEMASHGAPVIHSRAVRVGMEKNVVMEVRSSFNDLPGTKITQSPDKHSYRAIVHQNNLVSIIGDGFENPSESANEIIKFLNTCGIKSEIHAVSATRITLQLIDIIRAANLLHVKLIS